MRFIPVLLLGFAVWLLAGAAYAACSSPPGEAGDLIFNEDFKVVQWCDGDTWYAAGGGGSDTLSSLSCTDGQIPSWDDSGSEWVCADLFGSGGGADNLGNHLATQDIEVAAHNLNAVGRIRFEHVSGGLPPPLSYGGGGGGGGGGDTTPDPFSFTDQNDVATNTQITSNSVTINGLGSIAVASVSGDGSPQIRIGGGSWVTSGLIGNGQSIEVRLTSGGPSTNFTATVDIGGVTDNWIVSTVSMDGASSASAAPSCKFVLDNGYSTGNGLYWLDPDGSGGTSPFQAYCDMTTDGGGWTMVVAQFESDPVTNWNEGIQGDYDPDLSSSKGFALNTGRIPSHTEMGIGRGLDPTFIDYYTYTYTTGNITKTTITGNSGYSYHIHRNTGAHYHDHDPEEDLNTSSEYNNTLTVDRSGGTYFSWSFNPANGSSSARGYAMNGGDLGNSTQTYAWTVWVR